jgi:large subunit ribosomal protein L9
MIEVILKEPVETLGGRGDIVKVADGYARNYLLPRKLALAVTSGNKRQVDAERQRALARETEERAGAEALAARLGQVECVVSRRVGEKDTLYGSVTSADVADALARLGFEVDKRKIQLDEPLKALGEYTVPLKLHRDVTAQIKVLVVKAD